MGWPRWRVLADSYGGPSRRALVGEVNLDPAGAARYTRPDELHQAFAFGFLTAPWDAEACAGSPRSCSATRQPGGGAVTWVGENHDVVRTPTRYAPHDPRRGAARARAALLAVLGLPGGAYLYQGQELGLPEADVPESARQDPARARSGHSRDGCRVPIPWRRDPAGTFGFSAGRRHPALAAGARRLGRVLRRGRGGGPGVDAAPVPRSAGAAQAPAHRGCARTQTTPSPGTSTATGG